MIALVILVAVTATFALNSGEESPASVSAQWMYESPGLAMVYKVFVSPRAEDCYWQYVHPNANLFILVQVVKGGSVGVTVRNPVSEEPVVPYKVVSSTQYEHEQAIHGFYSVCLDNESAFDTKVVNMYLSTFRQEKWNSFNAELEELDVTVQNFSSTINAVERGVSVMHRYQTMSRELKFRDHAVLRENLDYVGRWSSIQILVVLLCTTVQVHFVKKLFKDPRDATNGISMRT